MAAAIWCKMCTFPTALAAWPCGKSIRIKLVLVSALGQTNGVIYARSQSYRRSDSEQRQKFPRRAEINCGQKWPPNKKQKEWDKFRRNIEKKKGIWLFWCWQVILPLCSNKLWFLPKKKWPKNDPLKPHRGIPPRFTAVSDRCIVSWAKFLGQSMTVSLSHFAPTHGCTAA